MKKTLSLSTARVDDAVLLIHIFLKVDLPNVLDEHFTRHGNQKGLSWGWIATIWLAHILTKGDHRKLTVRAWIAKCRHILSKTVGFEIQEIDFTDDKLTLLLKRFSDVETWHKIEEDLCASIMLAYHLVPEIVRVDATTVSGYHTGGENSFFQFGNSKEHPELLSVKIMQTTLDPLGLPISTTVVPGNRADDKLYIPAIERAMSCIKKSGVLFVGDSKMSSIETRSFLHRNKQHYLTPLANIGETPKYLREWVLETVENPQILQEIPVKTDKEGVSERCQGYSLERVAIDNSKNPPQCWNELVFVVYSPNFGASMRNSLDQRVKSAKEKLLALCLSARRRQNKTEVDLRKSADALLKKYQMNGILTYSVERIATTTTKYVGRGRGGADRPQKTVETVRYDLTEVHMDEDALKVAQLLMGWRAYVSNLPSSEISLLRAVEIYRLEHLIEHSFHRLKGIPLSLSPLFVHREDQVAGLIHFLSLAVRFLTLMEHRVRTNLKEQDAFLTGLHLENPKKENCFPTAERLLKQFSEITFTVVSVDDVEIEHITPHTTLQAKILELLELPPDIYSRLAANSG